MTKPWLGILAVLVATPLAAQRVTVGAGPTWRGGSGGYGYGGGLRGGALSVDAALSGATGAIGWFFGVAATLGPSGVAIPGCPAPPIGAPPNPCYSTTTLAGGMMFIRGGALIAPAGDRFEIAVGPALGYAPDLANPTQTSTALGVHLGAIVRPLRGRPLGLGLGATRLATSVTSVQWLVTPRIEFRF